MRPKKYLGARGGQWTRVDRVLAEGLIVYEGSLNPHGIPADRATDPERVFKIDEDMDYAVEAYEEAQEEYRTGENRKAGLMLRVIDAGVRED